MKRELHVFLSSAMAEVPCKYPYFDVVVGLVCLNDPESYIDSSVAIDRTSNARQVKGNDPDKGIPWSSSLGSGMGLKPPHKKYVLLRSF